MTRHRATLEGNIFFTPEEEAAFDAKEANLNVSNNGLINELLIRRNQALVASDWRASADLYLSPEWKEYRQALRDFPEAPGFPEDFIIDGEYIIPEPPANTEVITREQAIAKGLIAND